MASGALADVISQEMAAIVGLSTAAEGTQDVMYEGGCMCKAVRFQYHYSEGSKPFFSVFCHCETCRKLGSCSMQQVIGLPKASFSITKGEEVLKVYNPPNNKANMYRKFCGECGSGICQGPKDAPFVGTFPATYDFAGKFPEGNRLPSEFRPTCHINMENSLVGDVVKNDMSPKYKDFPARMGGSGSGWEWKE